MNQAGHKPRKSAGIASVVAQDFDAWASIGGLRGLCETVIPGVIFIVVYLATSRIVPSVAAPVAVSLVFLLVRLVQRIDVTPAIGGFLGLVVSAVWAWKTGQASDYFKLGLLTNLAYFAVILASLIARWPILGVLIGTLRGDPAGWRKDPDPTTRSRYTLVTWLWLALFGVRLAVQAPLFWADATTALAVTKLAMGPPLFALVAWLSWMLVRGLPPVAREDQEEVADDGEHAPAE